MLRMHGAGTPRHHRIKHFQILWILDFTERKTLASAVICIRELLRFNTNTSAGNGKQFLPSSHLTL